MIFLAIIFLLYLVFESKSNHTLKKDLKVSNEIIEAQEDVIKSLKEELRLSKNMDLIDQGLIAKFQKSLGNKEVEKILSDAAEEISRGDLDNFFKDEQ